MEKALFGRTDVSRQGTESSVQFHYKEFQVTVESDEWVTVSKRADETTDE